MNLRTQLSLFFGGLLALVLTFLVAANYSRLYEALESGLKEQFSLEPYSQLAEVERTLLLERANALVDRTAVLKGVRMGNNLLAQGGVANLAKHRADPELEGYVDLNSGYEQMLQVLSRTAGSEGQDLVVLASVDGDVIAESFNKSIEDGEFVADLSVSIESLAEQELWTTMSSWDSSRGYFVYPNKKLYLYGFATFLKGFRQEAEGVAVVGKEIDREFLARIVSRDADSTEVAGETHAIVLYGDQVVASSEKARIYGQELVNQEQPGETWSSTTTGRTFLVKSTGLMSYYLNQFEKDGFAQLGVLDDLPAANEVGRVFLLKDVSSVQAQAFSGARETLVLGGLALVLSLLAVPVLARRFTAPIRELTEAMGVVGEGKLQELKESQISSITEVKEAGLSFNQMVIGLKQKKILEHFVPEGTRKEIEALQGRTTELGGTRWERTIMFSDLRGFTSMSESMTPDEVMAVLNKYLHVMSKAIRVAGGDINEYIGDAILAVFESPDAAIKASIAMTEELIELRKDKSIDALAGLAQGIGLHTGPLVEGNIGEENRRLKRAVVGDTVNLAARIQDRSRDGSHSCIFISGDTKDRLKEPVELVHFGDEMFKGKAEPIPVWEVKI